MGAVVELDAQHHAVTDFGGNYHLDARPGTFTLRITAAGFEPVERSITVDIATTANVLLVPLPNASAQGKVRITSPESGNAVTDGSALILGTASGVDSVTVNGVKAELQAGQFKATIQLEPGDNPVYARGADAAGHVSADVIYLTWDAPDTVVRGAGCTTSGNAWLAALGLLILCVRRRGAPSRA
jgi:hypothetical protein